MITLYHGSYISVPAPLVKLGRKNVDFGLLIYFTQLQYINICLIRNMVCN